MSFQTLTAYVVTMPNLFHSGIASVEDRHLQAAQEKKEDLIPLESLCQADPNKQ